MVYVPAGKYTTAGWPVVPKLLLVRSKPDAEPSNRIYKSFRFRESIEGQTVDSIGDGVGSVNLTSLIGSVVGDNVTEDFPRGAIRNKR